MAKEVIFGEEARRRMKAGADKLAAAAAPTTQGLILQAEGHPGSAAVGNGNEAYVFVSVYNEAGPVHGLASGSLSASVIGAPTGAPPLRKANVTEPVSGIYRIALSPELSSQRWAAGTYVVGVALTSPNGSGVVVAGLVIGE
jgi:hypothetical protein